MTPTQRKPTYDMLGASHQKEDVHQALKNADKGLFPHAFCKIIEDIAKDPHYCSIIHADGAGTKSSIAYMMYKETGDLSVFGDLAQDSTVMNTDDVLCVGATDNFILSNTIGRNKKLITGPIIQEIIQGYERFLLKLREFGFPIHSCGGETADLGDIIRTVVIDSTLITRMPRARVITAKNIQKNDVIVGLSSNGKASYEDSYNSGIGSNGLTLARHGLLNHDYYTKYPECVAPELDAEYAYFGTANLMDSLPSTPLNVGEALLSPTRTYVPILLPLLQTDHQINAIFHNTGGGQSKCLHFGQGIHYIKDDYMKMPEIFNLIQSSSQTEWQEMFHVFNMGHRMEIICPESYAKDKVIPLAKSFEVDAKIIGHVEKSSSKKNQLTIQHEVVEFSE